MRSSLNNRSAVGGETEIADVELTTVPEAAGCLPVTTGSYPDEISSLQNLRRHQELFAGAHENDGKFEKI
jgi:hypothetical protein